jgi:hypothetical protein
MHVCRVHISIHQQTSFGDTVDLLDRSLRETKPKTNKPPLYVEVGGLFIEILVGCLLAPKLLHDVRRSAEERRHLFFPFVDLHVHDRHNDKRQEERTCQSADQRPRQA